VASRPIPDLISCYIEPIDATTATHAPVGVFANPEDKLRRLPPGRRIFSSSQTAPPGIVN
jgi:hypothetical protein